MTPGVHTGELALAATSVPFNDHVSDGRNTPSNVAANAGAWGDGPMVPALSGPHGLSPPRRTNLKSYVGGAGCLRSLLGT